MIAYPRFRLREPMRLREVGDAIGAWSLGFEYPGFSVPLYFPDPSADLNRVQIGSIFHNTKEENQDYVITLSDPDFEKKYPGLTLKLLAIADQIEPYITDAPWEAFFRDYIKRNAKGYRYKVP